MTSPATSSLSRLRARAAAIVAALAATTMAASLLVAPAASAAEPAGMTVLTPGAVPAITDVPNALRGQYQWMGYNTQTPNASANDVYYRDQVYWGRLQPAKDSFDFTWIEDGLRRAGQSKSKFGFRVMAYCPGCWMNTRTDFPDVTPSWLPTQPGTDIPDWNSETFLSSWETLMAELGKRYGNDPRLGYVDVGGYGNFGEWWVTYPTAKITDDNALRLIGAVNKAFPTKHVLINTMTSVDFTLKALATNPRMGIRTDSVGAKDMHSMVAVDARLQSVWKTRPFFAEWATTGDPVLGRDQVSQFHVSTLSSQNMRLQYWNMTAAQKTAYDQALRTAGYRYTVSRAEVSPLVPGQEFTVALSIANSGSAPTYDPWQVAVRLSNEAGTVVGTYPLTADLRTVLPGTSTATGRFTAPDVPAGTYAATVVVTDPSGYLDPMRLGNTGRTPDGAYPLGKVTLGPAAASALTVGSTATATGATLTGVLTRAGAPLAGVPVAIEKQTSAGAWTATGTVTTDGNGKVTATVPAGGTYRLAYAGSAVTSASASASVLVKAAAAMSATVAGTWPRTATATLKATATGKAIAGAPVTVRWRNVGSSTWYTAATVKTGSTGVVKYTTYPKTPRVIGFFYAGNDTLAATSTLVTMTTPTALAASVKTGRPNVLKARLTTKAGTALAGKTVYLQRRYSGAKTWTTIGSAKTSSTGYVTSKQAPKRKTYYRWVYKGESGKYWSVTSASKYVPR